MSTLVLLLLVLVTVINAAAPSCPFGKNNVMQSDGKSVLPVNGNGGIVMFPQFILFNNVWGVLNGTSLYTQTIFNCSNGAGYGWTWNRTLTSYDRHWLPNYPETAYGLSPYNSLNPSTSPFIPAKLSTIKYLTANHDIQTFVADNNGAAMWDFAYDIWWASVNPATTQASNNITDEIMIFFGWGTVMNKQVNNQSNAVYDGYNMFDYAEAYPNGGSRYHQFRIVGQQRIPPKVNLIPFFDYVQKRYNVPDVYLCSIELGNENWDGSAGTTIIKHLSYDFSAPTTTSPPSSTSGTSTTSKLTSASASTTSSTATSTVFSSTVRPTTSFASAATSSTPPASTTSTSSPSPPPSSTSSSNVGSSSASLLFPPSLSFVSLSLLVLYVVYLI